MEFQLGETYSGYEFLDILKRTKNGIEYRVRNTRANRLEALRALPQTAQNDQEQTERFLREMRVHATLVHPNIVTLFTASELEGHMVMTTELVEGTTLADRLQLGPLPWAEAVALCRQAAAALDYAHQQKIVHRNICPENMIIASGGVLKLANFALAKGASSPKLTQVGAVVGNLKYISPEQVKGMGDEDARSDIYALGMVLYEMLAGRPAFDLESQFELMAAQVNRIPSPPTSPMGPIPIELGVAVLKSLEKEPSLRYQTAAEFGEALARASEARPREPELVALPVANEASVVAAVADVAATPPMPAFLAAAEAPAISRKQLLIGGAAGAFLGALIMSVWLFSK